MPDLTAKWYDLIYDLDGKDYPAEVAELIELIDQRMPDATSLLDVACGTGRHLQLMADRFADTAALQRAIDRFAAHLEPAGLLIIDGWVTPDRWEDGRCQIISGAIEGGYLARGDRVASRGRSSVIEFLYLHVTPEHIEHLEEQIELTMFTEDEYRAAFEAAGLSMEVLASPMPGRDRYLGVRDEH